MYKYCATFVQILWTYCENFEKNNVQVLCNFCANIRLRLGKMGEYWSNMGQILVKFWANIGQKECMVKIDIWKNACELISEWVSENFTSSEAIASKNLCNLSFYMMMFTLVWAWWGYFIWHDLAWEERTYCRCFIW